MKRYLIIIILLLFAAPSLWAQRKDHHDTLRYNQMNEQGVWTVGVAMEPVVGMLHPLGSELGGGTRSASGIMGFMIEGGYFVADNMRLTASLGVVSDLWGGLFGGVYDGHAAQSQFKVRLGGHWHMARWNVGGGLLVGNTKFKYYFADTSQGGVNDPLFGDKDLEDRHTTLGLFYEVGYMISPFLKASAFYEPAIAFGGGYSHSFGARITIYLPFVSSVVCR